jgi:hypothetical protein
MPGTRLLAEEANTANLPSSLIDGLLLGPPIPGTGGAPLSTESTSVLGWTANNTEPVAVFPVLSVTVNVAVKLPCTVGVPVIVPVAGITGFSPAGKDPVESDHVNGAVPLTVTSVVE